MSVESKYEALDTDADAWLLIVGLLGSYNTELHMDYIVDVAGKRGSTEVDPLAHTSWF
jgi:hypothetical protein